MKKYSQLKKQAFQDPLLKKVYNELEPEFNFIETLIQKRVELGLTQADLANKIGTHQSAISRLESGSYNPSIDFLKKVAVALRAELRVTLV